MTEEFLLFSSDLGWTGLLLRGECIYRIWIGHNNRRDLLQRANYQPTSTPSSRQQQIVNRLLDFTSGKPTSLATLKIATDHMTDFQKRVTAACRQIPWGETLTYGQIAQIAGSPNASRAVGTVMANNRYPLVVPCHRVCSSTGLGGFSAPNGIALKRRLLENEFVFRGAEKNAC